MYDIILILDNKNWRNTMEIPKKEIIKKMFKSINGVGYIILFLVGLSFILSATINAYLDKKQSIEYKEAVATFYSSKPIETYNASENKFETEYEGIYKFVVNDQNYYASPLYTKGNTNFKKTLKIKYDPTNPNVYVIVNAYSEDYLIALVLWIILFICLRNGYDTEKKYIEYYATHRE